MSTRTIKIDRQAILRQEMDRIALVLRDASMEDYERAVQVVTDVVLSLPNEIPEWQPRIFRIQPGGQG